jgi:hypothetical protein
VGSTHGRASIRMSILWEIFCLPLVFPKILLGLVVCHGDDLILIFLVLILHRLEILLLGSCLFLQIFLLLSLLIPFFGLFPFALYHESNFPERSLSRLLILFILFFVFFFFLGADRGLCRL